MHRESNDGLQDDNIRGLKVGPLVTPEQLKNVYLTGLNITDPTTGEPLPDETYQTFINNAVAMLETELDLSITEVNGYVENRDYRINDYADFGYMQLNNYPIIEIEKMELTYLVDANDDPIVVFQIPDPWLRIQRHDGLLRLLPNNRVPGNLQVGATGFFPEILRVQNVPHVWRVTYSYGFKDGCIPTMINAVIAKLAAIQALIVGGNLIIGAGIAASSITVDGMSQMIQTTQSAENSAFSATIREYSQQVFGRSKGDPFSELRILKNY